MTESTERLLSQALSLPEADRCELANKLYDSLDEDFEDEAYYEELNRRLESVANGSAELLPADEAFATMRTELARRRAARQKGGAA